MGYLVKLPKLSMQMEVGTLVEWHVAESDEVREGDVLGEVESDKAIGEVECAEDGVVRRILVPEGDEAEPGTPIAIVADADEDIADLLAEAGAVGVDVGEAASSEAASASESETEENAVEPPQQRVTPRARKQARNLGVDPAEAEGTGPKGAVTSDDVERAAAATEQASPGSALTEEPLAKLGDSPMPEGGATSGERAALVAEDGRNLASPRARRLAEERGLELHGIEGTGPDGAIIGRDVEATSTGSLPELGVGDRTRTVVEERPLDGMRQTISDRLGESYRSAVHVTEHREVDAEALTRAADTASNALDQSISVTDVLLVALSEALEEHPAFNATFEDDMHKLYAEQNVGIAVDVEAGLVTPVIPDISKAAINDIAAVRRDLTDRTLEGNYTMDDLSGGTFTVTNLGVLGIDSFTPIINPPQVAILAVGRIREQPVRDGDDLGFRNHVTLSLSFDHRVVDGADAARFLATLADLVENADDLLIKRA